ncbi:MAG: alpha/beta fold hydrolase [Nitriliruptoraceae bacterium]|nr:alpha/beta fold hydrolase [Nitriliruptoraceae bacterium]
MDPRGAGPPVRLQTHVSNPSGRRWALLIHGLCSDGTCWWRLGSSLAAAGWLVVAPDLRGHGRSPTADRFDLATLAADVRTLGSGPGLLVGHSLGGAIAAHLLATDERIAAAVLVDPVMDLRPSVREGLRQQLRAEAHGLDAAQVRTANPDWSERDVWRKVTATALVTPDVVDAVLDDNDPWDLWASVEAWRAPVAWLSADPARGGLLDPVRAAALADGRRLHHESVDAGHSIHRERPDRVEAAVTRVRPDAFVPDLGDDPADR